MRELKIEQMLIGSVQTNCYFLSREGSMDAICIDPADNGDLIFEHSKGRGLAIKAILLTHGHFDHIWGCRELQKLTGCQVYAYEGERELLADAQMNLSAEVGRAESITADVYLKEGEELTISGMTCKVIATPGHTIGSCCYYFEQEELLISGDTLFQESVGRTDFVTGSAAALGRSLKEKLMVLPENVQVYPGHGDMTTIGYEARNNPFCI